MVTFRFTHSSNHVGGLSRTFQVQNIFKLYLTKLSVRECPEVSPSDLVLKHVTLYIFGVEVLNICFGTGCALGVFSTTMRFQSQDLIIKACRAEEIVLFS